MSKKGIMGLIALMCFVVLISGCISGDTDTEQSSDSSGSGSSSGSDDNWKSVETFSGTTDDGETDTFQIKGDKFKIKAKATGDGADVEYLYFAFITYEVGETMYVSSDELDFTQASETDEFIINEGPGEYYLVVYAANLESWEIEVFDYV